MLSLMNDGKTRSRKTNARGPVLVDIINVIVKLLRCWEIPYLSRDRSAFGFPCPVSFPVVHTVDSQQARELEDTSL